VRPRSPDPQIPDPNLAVCSGILLFQVPKDAMRKPSQTSRRSRSRFKWDWTLVSKQIWTTGAISERFISHELPMLMTQSSAWSGVWSKEQKAPVTNRRQIEAAGPRLWWTGSERKARLCAFLHTHRFLQQYVWSTLRRHQLIKLSGCNLRSFTSNGMRGPAQNVSLSSDLPKLRLQLPRRINMLRSPFDQRCFNIGCITGQFRLSTGGCNSVAGTASLRTRLFLHRHILFTDTQTPFQKTWRLRKRLTYSIFSRSQYTFFQFPSRAPPKTTIMTSPLYTRAVFRG
jgi:hypothetical protein